MRKKRKEELAPEDLIPIGVSVKILEERYPHLRNVSWNDKSDEKDEEE